MAAEEAKNKGRPTSFLDEILTITYNARINQTRSTQCYSCHTLDSFGILQPVAKFRGKVFHDPLIQFICNSIMTNPFHLPELIHRLGRFIQIWYWSDDEGLEFYPFDLMACLQVNKLWHCTLTPFLWAAYDDSGHHKEIPPEIVHAHSHHLRYLCLTWGWSTTVPPLNPTQLREIYVTGHTLPSCKGILRASSAHITDLTLSEFRNDLHEDTLPPLELPHLTRLTIQYCYNSRDIVGSFINANCGHLSELSFLDIKAWEPFSWQLFPNLTHLTLDTDLDKNPALVQLPRHCPRLETLTISPCSGQHYPTLSKNLLESCSFLKAIKSEYVFNSRSMSNDDCVSLIRA